MGAVVFFGASLQGVGEVRDRSRRAGDGMGLEEDGGKTHCRVFHRGSKLNLNFLYSSFPPSRYYFLHFRFYQILSNLSTKM